MGPWVVAMSVLAFSPEPQEAGRVGVMPVTMPGQSPAQLEAQIDEHVRAGLGAFELVDVGAGTACEAADCYRDIAEGAGVRALVRVVVSVEARDYTLRAELIDGATGEVERADESTCEICTYEEVLERLDQEIANLRSPIATVLDRPEGPTMAGLRISSDPADAIVRVDGEVVGSTPFEGQFAPGPHEVQVSKEGHRPHSEHVDLAEADGTTLELTLAPRRFNARLKRILGWTGVGVAIPLVAGGVALLVMDERSYGPSCDGLEGTCEFRFNTLGGGIVALVGGIAAGGAGATLLILDRRERGNVEAWFGPGGGGVRGRF